MTGTADVQAYMCSCVCKSLGSDSLGRACQTNNPNCNGVLAWLFPSHQTAGTSRNHPSCKKVMVSFQVATDLIVPQS